MLTATPIKTRLLSVAVSTAPVTPIFTTAQAKAYLNVDISDDDALIDLLITSVTDTIERETHRALLTQQITQRFRASSLPLRVYRPPVNSIVSIKSYYQGTATVEDHANCYISGGLGLRPKVFPNDDFDWADSDGIEEIEIVTSNGFGAAATAIPAKLLQAARKLLVEFYDHRADVIEGSHMLVPHSVRSLLAHFEVPVL